MSQLPPQVRLSDSKSLFQIPPWTFPQTNWSLQQTVSKQATEISGLWPVSTYTCTKTLWDFKLSCSQDAWPPQGVHCMQLQSVPTQSYHGCGTAQGLKRQRRMPQGTQVAQREKVYGRKRQRHSSDKNIPSWSVWNGVAHWSAYMMLFLNLLLLRIKCRFVFIFQACAHRIKRWWHYSSGAKECNYWNMRLRQGLLK